MLEKRNIIEKGRTPNIIKQADIDEEERELIKLFGDPEDLVASNIKKNNKHERTV